MGIIQKQASKSTIYIYVGIAIGFMNTLLFPHFLEPEEKGVLDAITSAGYLLGAIFSLGLPLTTLRLFPNFRNPEKNSYGYLTFLLLLSGIGFLLGLVVLDYVFKVKVPSQNQSSFYFILLASVFLFRLLFNNLDAYNRMLYNVTLGQFLLNVVLKGLILVFIIGFSWNLIALESLYALHVVALCSPGIILLIYLLFKSRHGLSIKPFFNRFRELQIKKDFIQTSFYSLVGAIGGIVVLEIDRLMLFDFMGTKEVGIYSTAALFGVMVNIPSRALRGIASVVISDSWKRGDIQNISTVYKKSTLNLQILSGFLFICIVLCSKYVYSFMKPEYIKGIDVILLIAISQFVDALTSVNTEILSTSKSYKYQTLFMFLMIGLVVGLNYSLIPEYGMKGAAISTMLSIIITNIVRTIFIKVKFGLSPFTMKNLKVLIITVGVFFAANFVDSSLALNEIFNLIIVGTFTTVLFWSIILKLNISEDFSVVINKFFKSFVNR